jgi:hypothetical protein
LTQYAENCDIGGTVTGQNTLEENGRWIIRYSWPSGHPYRDWENDVGSVIPKRYLQMVFYVYPDKNSGERGAACGATGFFVKHQYSFLDGKKRVTGWYAVTNDHALRKKGAGAYYPNPAIRFNVAGKAETFQTNRNRWICNDHRDIAVLPLFYEEVHSDVEFLESYNFAGETSVSNEAVERGGWLCYGLGDEVFMVGRLLDRDGKEVNYPSIRTGIISMAPCPATEDEFLIECRSIGGYSGAPVFACATSATPPSNYRTRSLIKLIGINRGNARAHKIGNTGMTFVVPSWYILELLNSPLAVAESAKMYKQNEEYERKRQRELDSRAPTIADIIKNFANTKRR